MIRVLGILTILSVAGCTFTIAPNATDGSLLTVRGGGVAVPEGRNIGTNGVPASVGAEPQSTSDRIVYVLFAVATAAYPIWRQIRKWRENKNGNGAKVIP